MTHAVSGALRKGGQHVAMDPARAVVYAPDAPHEGEWPTFTADTLALLKRAGVAAAVTKELPSPTIVNELFTEFLAAHFKDFIAGDELPMRQGIPAVLLALATGGRLDKRVHPNTALLLAGTAALALRYRDRDRAVRRVGKLRADIAAIWESGALVVSPTCTWRPPKHGRAAWAYRIMTFCKLGNLTDATGLALPFGHYRVGGEPAMPRSLQILGPPGSEDAIFALAERLEAAIGQGAHS